MVLVFGVESEEVSLVPTDAGSQIIAVQIVVAHIGIERGIAVEHLALRGSQSHIALRTVVHQTLPTSIVEAVPVHAHRRQCLIVITIHQLLDQAWRTILTQFKAHDGIDVVVAQETMLKVQLITECIAISIVGLLHIASAIRQQALTVLVNKGIVCQSHLVGIGIIIHFTAALRPLILEHDVIPEPLQELGL